ncbi:MAG: hypothetical protein EPO24_13230 [Bacteroidetes bacterium]|nr:MAG: hypothetical protein EPO24_13230 [Bacteroidota bacterium]
MKSIGIFLLLAACFLESSAVAQPKLWEIYSTSNQPYVNVTVDRYQSDSLYMKFMNQTIVIHQDSIRYIVRKKSSKVGIGLLLGAVGGGLFGGLISGSSPDNRFSDFNDFTMITAGIAVGGVIGGAMGAAGTDTRYQIDTLDPEKKKELLVKLFPEPATE